jgi:hypothetical protein
VRLRELVEIRELLDVAVLALLADAVGRQERLPSPALRSSFM